MRKEELNYKLWALFLDYQQLKQQYDELSGEEDMIINKKLEIKKQMDYIHYHYLEIFKQMIS